MSAEMQEAQGHLREIVRALGLIELCLIGVAATLPPSPTEADRLKDAGSEETDPVTELHSVIQCALTDSLRPLISDLQAVSELEDRGKGGEGEEKE